MRLPENIDAATERLTGINSIVTASEWERSAIVYAFTEVQAQNTNRHTVATSSSRLTPGEFAALGIVGLKSKDTVRRYHEAWQAAIDAGRAMPLQAGDEYIEPAMNWPPVERTPAGAGATMPRILEALQNHEFVAKLVGEMDSIDAAYLMNALKGVLTSLSPLGEDGPLDLMTAFVDMRDGIDRITKAEPSWSRAAREGNIPTDVSESQLGDLEIVHDLMRIAIDSDSFERTVPR